MFKNNLFFERNNTYSSLEKICLLILSNVKNIDKTKNKKSLTVKLEHEKLSIEEIGFYIKKELKRAYRFNLFLSIEDNYYFNSANNNIKVYIEIKEKYLNLADIEKIKTQMLSQQLNVIDVSSINCVLDILNIFVKGRKARNFGVKIPIEENENIIKKNKIYKKSLKAKSYLELIPSMENRMEIKYDFLNRKIKKEVMIQSKYPKTNKNYNFGISFPLGINPFVDDFENRDFLRMMYNKVLLKEVGLELEAEVFKNFKECSRKIKQITDIQGY